MSTEAISAKLKELVDKHGTEVGLALVTSPTPTSGGFSVKEVPSPSTMTYGVSVAQNKSSAA